MEVQKTALYNYHIGDTPDTRAIETAKNYGVNIQNIRARKINLNDINVFDMIIGMDKNHITALPFCQNIPSRTYSMVFATVLTRTMPA